MEPKTMIGGGAGIVAGVTGLFAAATGDQVVAFGGIASGIALTGYAIWRQVDAGVARNLKAELADAYKENRECQQTIDRLRQERWTADDECRKQRRRDRDEVHFYRSRANDLAMQVELLGGKPVDLTYAPYSDDDEARAGDPRNPRDDRRGDADLPRPPQRDPGKPGNNAAQ